MTRREAEAFLVGRGCRIAPVTLDAWDWMFAGVYEHAKKRGDAALQQKLAQSYLEYSDAMFANTEQLAKTDNRIRVETNTAAAREST